MQQKTFLIMIITLIFTSTLIAQMTVKDSDTNVLLQVNDEGSKGSLTLSKFPAATYPSTTTDKLYNVNGSLYFNGSVLATGGGVSAIHDLSDGKSLGSSVYLGSDAGASHTTGNLYNIGVGIEALKNNTGEGNTASGFQALYSNTTGTHNTANGLSALYSNTTGIYNTANGTWALNKNTSGGSNTANGNSALFSNTTGIGNTAGGYQALFSNTTGNYNTAIGIQANRYNQEGSNNTIIGYEAGKGTSNHNKSGNVFLGYQAGFNETGSNKLYIENSDSPTPLIGGDFSTNQVDINGQIKITGGSPVAGEVLTTDGTGLATWETVSTGATDINGLSDGKTIGESVYLGAGAGASHTTGDLWNVAVGIDALNANTYGKYNTASGKGALFSNTYGQLNTASGFHTLYFNTGSYNTASGAEVLVFNTTGASNTASGHKALHSNTSGGSNTASGCQALYSNTTGGGNTACGKEALWSNTTGSENTALGCWANVTAVDLTNATAIGYNAQVDASNKVRIGNTAVSVIEGQVAFTSSSDSTKKENLLKAEGEEVLEKISNMWLGSWNFKGKDNLRFRHYGPMAQAFFRAFGNDSIGTVGTDTTICASDIDGINMIAIQALEKRTAEDRIIISELKETNEKIIAVNEQIIVENSNLKTELAQLKSIVADLCERMGDDDIRVSSAE